MKTKKFKRNTIKEAFDNLPSGICYFSKNGIPVLCNRTMHRLCFSLTGRDLQFITDLTDALLKPNEERRILKDDNNYIFPDGSVWQFSGKTVQAEDVYTEYLATNVTELYEKKQALIKSTAEHEQMVKNMRRIVNNVTAITREEEILTMKMKIHSEVGIALQRLRRYHAEKCPLFEKDEVVEHFEAVVNSLMGEIGNDDEADALSDLLRIAATLGVRVNIQGIMPTKSRQKKSVVMAVRECITNTLRHAGGNAVTVEITEEDKYHRVRITNNGIVPKEPVTEGGGLTSLRRQIEKSAGFMTVESEPVFALIIKIPKGSEE